MTLRSLGATFGMLILSACVSTNVVKLGNGPSRPKIPLDQVAVYRTASQVTGKYEEVALLNSKGEAGETSEAEMLKNMRFKAGEVGANAIILDAVTEPGAGTKIAGMLLGTGAERKGRAVAIYVFRDASRQP